MDHDFIGPLLRRGMAAGRVAGERALLLKQMAKRFGPLPEWVSERIAQLGKEELEDLGVRFLDAQSLEELFGAH
jgi:hypothetical protein